MHQWTVSELVQVMACCLLSHYMDQCWFIVIWTPENKFQWNLDMNFIIFIKENAFEMLSAKMAAILKKGGHLVQGEMS